MKFEKTEVFNFEGAFRGMRNPKESWYLSDSFFGLVREEDLDYCNDILNEWEEEYKKKNKNFNEEKTFQWLCLNGVIRESNCSEVYDCAFLGPNDLKLAQTLIKGGPEHRKFLRQISVSVDITAPLYWFKEFDTYKIGTTANSTSTMHKILSKPITIASFEAEDFENYRDRFEDTDNIFKEVSSYIDFLENLRGTILKIDEKLKYIKSFSVEEQDYRNKLKERRAFLWKQLIKWLPSSWLQTRTITLNYENLFSIAHQRKYHKLTEWSGDKENPKEESFIGWMKTLPYASELILLEK